MTSDQEQQVYDALIALGGLETQQGLHSEGVHAIQTVLACSREDARAVLNDLRVRNLIEETVTPTPAARFHWVRPPAQP